MGAPSSEPPAMQNDFARRSVLRREEFEAEFRP
jgi:hypothetical protein